MTSTLRSTFDLPATARPTVGDLKMSIVNVDHIGWLRCDGRALSTDEYRILFAVLGYRFGGSGNTFYLPDPQGRVLGCAGTSTDTTWSIGDVSGEETHVLTTEELPPHNHDTTGTADPADPGFTTNNATGITNQTAGTHAHTGVTDASGSHLHTGTTDAAGSHTHGVTDLGHAHTYGMQRDDGNSSNTNGQLPAGDANPPQAYGVSTSSNTTGIAIVSDGDHTHTFTTATTPNHVHTFLSDTSGAHTHAITDPTHHHQIASVGGGAAMSLMQPTLFVGNLFIYSGRPFHRITTGDGITRPATYPNIFPLDPDYEVF